MSEDAKKAVETMYYETDIPNDEEQEKARDALVSLVKGWTGGKDLSDNNALYELESQFMRRGFLYGFQCAARMGELLKEAACGAVTT